MHSPTFLSHADYSSIVAVPGLGSHALGSWKSPHSDDVWLRDFLPKDMPNIRVLLYGYDTSLQGSLSNQSMEDLGRGFLEKIIAFRANDGVSSLDSSLELADSFRLAVVRSSSLATASAAC